MKENNNHTTDDVNELIENWGAQDSFLASSVVDGVPKFKKVDCYTTFLAEYDLIGDDIVIHFFETEEYPASNSRYWLHTFAATLDSFAQDYFNANSPRLVAKYTEELKSWWFKACGYDHLLDLDAFVMRFFEGLDVVLDITQQQ